MPNPRNKADKIFQIWFMSSHTKCEACGKPAVCGHHFFPKSVASSLRYNPDNMVAICQGCHLHHHNGDPRIHAKIMEDRGRDWYNGLLAEKEKLTKTNKAYYEGIIKHYNQNIGQNYY